MEDADDHRPRRDLPDRRQPGVRPRLRLMAAWAAGFGAGCTEAALAPVVSHRWGAGTCSNSPRGMDAAALLRHRPAPPIAADATSGDSSARCPPALSPPARTWPPVRSQIGRAHV